jgi:hypothetical protein
MNGVSIMEIRRQELGAVKFFVYYKVLIPLGALFGALTVKSSGHSISSADAEDPERRQKIGGWLFQGFLLLNLFPAALISSAGIILGWSLAPILYFGALGFVAALTISTVVMALTYREMLLAARSVQRRKQEELRGS